MGRYTPDKKYMNIFTSHLHWVIRYVQLIDHEPIVSTVASKDESLPLWVKHQYMLNRGVGKLTCGYFRLSRFQNYEEFPMLTSSSKISYVERSTLPDWACREYCIASGIRAVGNRHKGDFVFLNYDGALRDEFNNSIPVWAKEEYISIRKAKCPLIVFMGDMMVNQVS